MARCSRLVLVALLATGSACGSSNNGPAAGTVVWLKNLRGTDADSLRMVVDKNDNVVVACINKAPIDLGGGVLGDNPNQPVLLVAKYSSSADFLWGVGYSGDLVPSRLGLGVDGAGDVVVSARFAGTIDFGAGPVTGLSDALPTGALIELGGEKGDLIWAESLETPTEALEPNDLAVDSSDNIVVASTAQAVLDGTGAALTPPGPAHALVVGVSGDDGHVLWTRAAGDAASTAAAQRVAVTSKDTVLVSGTFTGSITFDTSLQADAGSTAHYIAGLDGSNGAPLWSQIITADADTAVSVTAGKDNHFAVVADTTTPAPGGGNALHFTASLLDATGASSWSATFGSDVTTDSLAASSVHFDSAGRVLVAGTFEGNQTFGDRHLSSPDAMALFVVKLDGSKGTSMWARYSGGTGDVTITDVDTDRNDQVLLGGSFESLSSTTTPDTTAPQEVFFLKLAP